MKSMEAIEGLFAKTDIDGAIQFPNLTEIQHQTVQRIADLGSQIELYSSARVSESTKNRPVPFEIGADPFKLPEQVANDLPKYGHAIVNYYRVCDDLYQNLDSSNRWKKYLDHSKPKHLLDKAKRDKDQSHIFLRPDFILTEDGVTTTEIETSPFGLPLAHFLNDGYRNAGRETLVNSSILIDHLIESLGLNQAPIKKVDFIVTPHTKNYTGQFIYLCKILKERGIEAEVKISDELNPKEKDSSYPRYRAFYLHEILTNPALQSLIEDPNQSYPACKPHLEEKALMALLFAPEFEDYFRSKLGANYEILKKIFPRTFIIDREVMPSNFPEDIKKWIEIAQLPSGKRRYVVKSSGFNPNSSWGKSVVFLHKLSKEKCANLIEEILNGGGIFVIQEFQKGKTFSQTFFDFETGTAKIMSGKVRITPYFATSNGQMLTVKATLCANTDYIHAMLDSINSPVI